jgi:hypothetical protein
VWTYFEVTGEPPGSLESRRFSPCPCGCGKLVSDPGAGKGTGPSFKPKPPPAPDRFEQAVERVLDVIAPRSVTPGERPFTIQSKLALLGVRPETAVGIQLPESARCPIFEWGHETTPTDEELTDLAQKIVRAVFK